MDICNILVVEDDPDINKLLCRILEGAGYACRPAFSGSEAALWAGQYEYDLVLLDLMLPGLTGEEFIAQMRKKKTMPIIVLSAKAGLEDRVNVLKLGADDFIPKPFDNAEVLARVEAQLRRYKQFSGASGGGRMLTHGDLTLDRDSVTVTAGGRDVTLTAREFEILALLMEHPNSTSRCGAGRTWGTTTPSTSTSPTCAPSWPRPAPPSTSRPSGASASR